MFWTARRLCRAGLINIGLIEQAEHELDPQDAGRGAVQILLGQVAVFDQRYQRVLVKSMLEIVKLHVHARGERLPDRVGFTGGRLVDRKEPPDRAEIGADKPVKAPFVAQNSL